MGSREPGQGRKSAAISGDLHVRRAPRRTPTGSEENAVVARVSGRLFGRRLHEVFARAQGTAARKKTQDSRVDVIHESTSSQSRIRP